MVVARRLYSGDMVLMFTKGRKEIFIINTDWVKRAFGDEAAIIRRIHAVIAKGIPVGRL